MISLLKKTRSWFLNYLRYTSVFFKWLGFGGVLGILGGLVGTAFCYALGYAASLRQAYPLLIWFLPLGGLLIVFLFSRCGMHPTDTNGILLAVHTPSSISASTAPLIFIGASITHLLGGSAGREGAALQLGGVLGWHTARALRQQEKDTHVVVMSGMSAVFAALFGTPITAAIFAMEVASVGILHFSAIVPCLTSALVASHIAHALGVASEAFVLDHVIPQLDYQFILGTILISAVCAVLSIIFCVSLKAGHSWTKKMISNPYVRIAAAGLCISLLTWMLGTTDYNGAGMHVVERAMHGNSRPEAFLLKLIFTVITMSCGYKGGEIVPAMFIGATAGCTLGNLLGLPVGLGAAVGLIAMFCGSLNCPISAIFLGIELFGGGNIHFYAIASAISFVLSCNYGLYSEQKIVYSKIHPEFINRFTD